MSKPKGKTAEPAKAKPAETKQAPAADKPLTAAGFVRAVGDKVGDKKGAFMEALTEVIKSELAAHGTCNLGSLIKIKLVQKPATPAYSGKDKFTGKERDFPSKPASKSVKAMALKGLKDLA